MTAVLTGLIALCLVLAGGAGGWFAHEHFDKPEIVTNTVVYDIKNQQDVETRIDIDNNMIQSTTINDRLFVITNHITNTVTNTFKTTNYTSRTNIR